jgi:hypothetical protein
VNPLKKMVPHLFIMRQVPTQTFIVCLTVKLSIYTIASCLCSNWSLLHIEVVLGDKWKSLGAS